MVRTLEEITVGEEVMMTDISGPTRAVKVERVGRTNIYIGGVRETAFDRKTGKIKDRYGHKYLMTIGAWEQQKLAETAKREMMNFGIEIWRLATPEHILAIHAALKPLMDAAKAST